MWNIVNTEGAVSMLIIIFPQNHLDLSSRKELQTLLSILFLQSVVCYVTQYMEIYNA